MCKIHVLTGQFHVVLFPLTENHLEIHVFCTAVHFIFSVSCAVVYHISLSCVMSHFQIPPLLIHP